MALGLFSLRRTITLTASASDRVMLDKPDSSSFSFTSVFSVCKTHKIGDANYYMAEQKI